MCRWLVAILTGILALLVSTWTLLFNLAGRAALRLCVGTKQNADLAMQGAMQAHQQVKALLDQTYSISAQVGSGLQRTDNLQNPDCLDVWRHFPKSPTRVLQRPTRYAIISSRADCLATDVVCA